MRLTLCDLVNGIEHTSLQSDVDDQVFQAIDALLERDTNPGLLASAVTDAFAIVGLFWSLKMLIEREVIIARCLDATLKELSYVCDLEDMQSSIRRLSCL